MPVRAASGAPAGGEAAGRAESRRGSARSAFLRTALLLLAASALAVGGDAVVHAPPPPVRRLAHARAVRRPLNRTHSTLSKSSLIGYDAQAKCTDGSPAYVFSAMFKTPAMAATWVMYLPATYMCWDATSCAKLQFWHPDLLTSRQFPKAKYLSGLFSPQAKNPLANANMHYVGYCSADAWLGGSNQTTGSGEMEFNGRAILRAAITRMVSLDGFGAQRRYNNEEMIHRLLLVGGGLGGVGVMANLDWIAPLIVSLGIPATAFTVQGLLDGGAWAPLEPLNVEPPASASKLLAPPPPMGSVPALTTPPLLMAVAALNWLNVTATQLSDGCMTANTGRPALCLFPQYRLPYLETPYLLSAPLYDKRQLTVGVGARLSSASVLTPAEAAYAAQLASATEALLPPIRDTANAAFAPACLKGPVGLRPTFWGMRVAVKEAGPQGELSLRDCVSSWFLSNSSGFTVVDTCTGFDCGTGCRRHPAPIKNRLLVTLAAPPPPAHGKALAPDRWELRFLGVAVFGAALYLFYSNVIVPMAQSAGLVQAPPPLPRPVNSKRVEEGTPLLPRGGPPGGRPGARAGVVR